MPDPCRDAPTEFLEKYEFTSPPTPFSRGAIVGTHYGKSCSFRTDGSYHVIIGVTEEPVAIGVAEKYNKLIYEKHTIGGMPAEIARVQNRTNSGGSYVSSGSCELNVEMPDHLLTFYLTNADLADRPKDPCDLLTELASDFVGTLPPEG